ncbi:MotA/TolQ/ExbB proton channel family protein [Desulfococcus sp.]|uniref:MotA/TolQ/ExbB proton channel family protein n=1 Tax=Desulfococcus sp. TaxID=2025834 RepID=UPI003593F608
MNGLEAVAAYTRAGGPVMVPLIIVSLLMWQMVALKCLWLLQVRRHPLKLADAFELICGRREPASKAHCPEGSRMSVLAYFLGHRSQDPETDRIIWEAAFLRQLSRLNRYLTAIRVLGAVAPLLGLLGTVSGMIETFHVIGFQGTGNSQAMASGIKEALITTQTGLLIAIPGLFAGQVLAQKVRDIKGNLMVFHRAVDQWLERGIERGMEPGNNRRQAHA